jgi:hypothetical protein
MRRALFEFFFFSFTPLPAGQQESNSSRSKNKTSEPGFLIRKMQGCTLHAVATSYGAIAASQRSSPADDSGFSFVGCRLTGTGMLYLGRAWGRYARVVYSYCDLSGIVVPEGWSDWGDESRTR